MHVLTKLLCNVVFFVLVILDILHLDIFYLRAHHIRLLFSLQRWVSKYDGTVVT